LKHVVWPPELPLLHGLLLPDPARAEGLRRCGAIDGDAVHVHVETGARPAAGCAAALAREGIAHVVLGGTPGEAAAGAVLRAALEQRGIAVAVLAHQRQWEVPPVELPDVRLAGGALPNGGLPGWVRAIRWHRAGAEAAPDVDAPDVLHAVDVTAAAPVAALAELCRSLVARVGARRVRLHAAAPASRFGCRALAVLADCDLRERVLALADAALPQHLPLLRTACHWCDLGVDPLLQTWAGNGIAERNRDLVVNLVR
jgi:hypothetical protein